MKGTHPKPATSSVVIALTAALAAPWPVAALEYRAGEEVLIAAHERIDDDMLILARKIRIDGTVTGDVQAYGLRTEVNGSIEGDLFGCGQEIVIGGSVGDDLRLAGMVLTIATGSSVGDDLLWAGLRLATEPGSATGGSLLFAGYEALLAGSVAEDVTGEAVSVELSGDFAGDVRLDVARDRLTVTDSARIGGKLSLESESTTRAEGAFARGLRSLAASVIVTSLLLGSATWAAAVLLGLAALWSWAMATWCGRAPAV